MPAVKTPEETLSLIEKEFVPPGGHTLERTGEIIKAFFSKNSKQSVFPQKRIDAVIGGKRFCS